MTFYIVKASQGTLDPAQITPHSQEEATDLSLDHSLLNHDRQGLPEKLHTLQFEQMSTPTGPCGPLISLLGRQRKDEKNR